MFFSLAFYQKTMSPPLAGNNVKIALIISKFPTGLAVENRGKSILTKMSNIKITFIREPGLPTGPVHRLHAV